MTETDDPNGKLSLTEIVNNLVTKSWHYEHKFLTVCVIQTLLSERKKRGSQKSLHEVLAQGSIFYLGDGEKGTSRLEWGKRDRPGLRGKKLLCQWKTRGIN